VVFVRIKFHIIKIITRITFLRFNSCQNWDGLLGLSDIVAYLLNKPEQINLKNYKLLQEYPNN